MWPCSDCMRKRRWEAVRIRGGFSFSPKMRCWLCFQDQIAYLCFQAFLPGNQIICGFAGCPLPWSPCLSPVTTVGLFVSAFPCSQMLLWSLNRGGRAAFETVCSASKAPARSLAARCREVLRALNTGCCHLSACLKRCLANLISCPKNRPGSCSHSSKGDAPWKASACWGFDNSHQEAERYRTWGVLFALEFCLTGHWWHFYHTCFPPLSPNTGNFEFFTAVAS